ncbi:MAG: hypothetical protein KDJ22_04560 [Candidatus Competibacteraceae bacterium]|nr:hypothetical protein [Candidatus Competibacteraceae bacterium]
MQIVDVSVHDDIDAALRYFGRITKLFMSGSIGPSPFNRIGYAIATAFHSNDTACILRTTTRFLVIASHAKNSPCLIAGADIQNDWTNAQIFLGFLSNMPA